jgi:hypothetical protein
VIGTTDTSLSIAPEALLHGIHPARPFGRLTPAAARADTRAVYEHRRTVVWMVGVVAGLLLLGWRMSAMRDTTKALAEAQQELGSVGEAIQGAIGDASQAGALASVQRAAALLEATAAQQGTYAGITTEALRALDPALDPTVVVVYSTDGGYCVQAGRDLALAHSTGAGPVPGPCR